MRKRSPEGHGVTTVGTLAGIASHRICGEGWWDTRPAEGRLGEGGLCDRAEAEGAECTECSDGARSCLRLEIVLARAQGWDGELITVDP